ncbi:hypothetical protein [Marinicauda pacifica]
MLATRHNIGSELATAPAAGLRTSASLTTTITVTTITLPTRGRYGTG